MHIGTGTRIYINENLAGWEVLDIRLPSEVREPVDAVEMQDEFVRDVLHHKLITLEKFEVDIAFDPRLPFMTALLAQPVNRFTIQFGTEHTEQFSGWVAELTPADPVEDKMVATIAIQPVGGGLPVQNDPEFVSGMCNGCSSGLSASYTGGITWDHSPIAASVIMTGQFQWVAGCMWSAIGAWAGAQFRDAGLVYDPLLPDAPWRIITHVSYLDGYAEIEYAAKGLPCAVPEFANGSVSAEKFFQMQRVVAYSAGQEPVDVSPVFKGSVAVFFNQTIAASDLVFVLYGRDENTGAGLSYRAVLAESGDDLWIVGTNADSAWFLGGYLSRETDSNGHDLWTMLYGVSVGDGYTYFIRMNPVLTRAHDEENTLLASLSAGGITHWAVGLLNAPDGNHAEYWRDVEADTVTQAWSEYSLRLDITTCGPPLGSGDFLQAWIEDGNGSAFRLDLVDTTMWTENWRLTVNVTREWGSILPVLKVRSAQSAIISRAVFGPPHEHGEGGNTGIPAVWMTQSVEAVPDDGVTDPPSVDISGSWARIGNN